MGSPPHHDKRKETYCRSFGGRTLTIFVIGCSFQILLSAMDRSIGIRYLHGQSWIKEVSFRVRIQGRRLSTKSSKPNTKFPGSNFRILYLFIPPLPYSASEGRCHRMKTSFQEGAFFNGTWLYQPNKTRPEMSYVTPTNYGKAEREFRINHTQKTEHLPFNRYCI